MAQLRIILLMAGAVLVHIGTQRTTRAEEPIRLPATADNSIVLYEGEEQLNAGSQTRIRIKGNQHLVTLAFDLAALKGRTVAAAVLVCERGEQTINGLTISTIQAPWDERGSNALVSGSGPQQGWGVAGQRFIAVTDGNSNSLVGQAKSNLEENTYRWTVPPGLVEALAVGAAYGLTLHEWEADYSRNPTICSREQAGKGPYLLVTAGLGDGPPDPPTGLKTSERGDADSLRLHLTAPRHGFAYEVKVDGAALGRWNIPFVQAGAEQVIPIRDLGLKPGQKIKISVVTLNRSGARSAAAEVSATVPGRAPLPTPDGGDLPPAVMPARAGIGVVPALDRYDLDGKPVGKLPADYPTHNAIYDGRTIRLTAARGEVLSLQLLLTGRGAVSVEVKTPGVRADLSRAVYVKAGGRMIPDPLLPLTGPLELEENKPAVVVVDLYVPFEERRGQVSGQIALSDGRAIPLEIQVRTFALPKAASFFCEMNSYGLPDKLAEFNALERLAYEHRCHVNILYYSHQTAAPGARKTNLDMVLADGRRMDEKRFNAIEAGDTRGSWDDFARAFGPYLSGELFRDGFRGPIPAPGFYLPFHESWPLNVRAYFDGNPDAFEAFRGKPLYAQTFTALLRDFQQRAEQEGWSGAGLQVFLNNKGALKDAARSPWVLDEPTSYWDYRALGYFGGLVRSERKEKSGIVYRIDISRPEFTRGQLDGVADLWVVGTGAWQRYRRLIEDRVERSGERIWIYGCAAPVEESSRQIQAWILSAVRGGAEGIVPWQTINRDGTALTQGDPLGLLILEPQGGGSPARVRGTLRLKAFLRGQQDAEYLHLLQQRRQASAEQMRGFIDHYLPAGGADRARQAEEASAMAYEASDPKAFHRLREAAGQLIEEAKGP